MRLVTIVRDLTRKYRKGDLEMSLELEEALEKASQLEREYGQKIRSCKGHKNFFKIFIGKEAVRQSQEWRDRVFLEERMEEERKAMEDAYDEREKLREEI